MMPNFYQHNPYQMAQSPYYQPVMYSAHNTPLRQTDMSVLLNQMSLHDTP